jgi:hypothetical protein
MSPLLVEKMKNELKNYELLGATIHFKPEKPLSLSIIEKILKERLM